MSSLLEYIRKLSAIFLGRVLVGIVDLGIAMLAPVVERLAFDGVNQSKHGVYVPAFWRN